MAISMLKIRRPLGRLIFNMGIAIPGKTVFLIETAPSIIWMYWWLYQMASVKAWQNGLHVSKGWHSWDIAWFRSHFWWHCGCDKISSYPIIWFMAEFNQAGCIHLYQCVKVWFVLQRKWLIWGLLWCIRSWRLHYIVQRNTYKDNDHMLGNFSDCYLM